jgi:hypothetical protein
MLVSRRSLLVLFPIMIAAGSALWFFTFPSVNIEDAIDDGEVLQIASPKELTPSWPAQDDARIPAADSARVDVLVTCESGKPVRSAGISLVCGDDTLTEGRTTAEGIVSFKLPEKRFSNVTSIVVRAEGYALGRYAAQHPLPSTVRIVLARGARIQGDVRLQNGSIPRPGVRVYAWLNQPRARPPLGYLSPVRTPPPQVLWTETDSSGHFIFEHLLKGHFYNLAAGALGWTSSRLMRSIESGTTKVDLTLWRVYACAVKIRERGGVLPPRCKVSAARTKPSRLPGSTHCASLSILDRALSGLSDFKIAKDRLDWRDFALSYKDGRVQSLVSPVIVGIDVPGFHSLVARVPLFALEGTLPSRTLFVDRSVAGFGSIRIQLLSPLSSAPHPIKSGPAPGVLRLRPINGGAELKIDFNNVGQLERQVVDVPFGSYRVHFTACNGGFQASPVKGPDVLLVGRQQQVLTFDLSSLAAVRLRLVDAEGKQTIDPGALIVRGEKKGGKRVSFMRMLVEPPFVLEGLVAGEWTFSIATSQNGRRAHAKVSALQLRPGVLVERKITLDQK